MDGKEPGWREEAEWWLVQRGIDFESIEFLAQLLQRAEQRGLERAAGIGDNAAPDGFFGDEAWGFSEGWDAKVDAIRALIAEGRGEEKTQGEGVGS